MTAMRQLIEAVEAGIFIHNDAITPRHREGLAAMAFDGSLDAAKALHEALLPGWEVDMIIKRRANVMVSTQKKAVDATSDTPARAWLIAILKAYEAQQ